MTYSTSYLQYALNNVIPFGSGMGFAGKSYHVGIINLKFFRNSVNHNTPAFLCYKYQQQFTLEELCHLIRQKLVKGCT